jgi:hypothetical protein
MLLAGIQSISDWTPDKTLGVTTWHLIFSSPSYIAPASGERREGAALYLDFKKG